MQTSEMKHLLQEFFGFLDSDENMRTLEELTVSLKNALTRYEVDSETPNGTPLYNTFCDAYNELMKKAVAAVLDTEKSPMRPADLTMLVQLAEYGVRRGNRVGAFVLGYFYLYGAGVTQSLHQAFYFLQLAANISQFYIANHEYMQKDPDGYIQTILEVTSSEDEWKDLTAEERKELASKVIDDLHASVGKNDLYAEHSAQFGALSMATLVQLYITMQPHTPNLTVLGYGAGEQMEDYIAIPTEYTALLNQMLAAEKKHGNPTIAGDLEQHMQGLRNCLKYPFPDECRQKGHDELRAAMRTLNDQYAMEHWQLATGCYLCAAIQGDAEAAAGMGYCCEHVPGHLTDTYRQLAMQWYQHAAKAGSAWAMQRVGQYYDQGLCGPIDHKMANRCFELARKMGMPA